jgi:hypothetical protein
MKSPLSTSQYFQNSLQHVIDAAELCQSAHASSEWCDSASTVFFRLQEYIATLNADQDLYQSLVMIVNYQSDYFQGLNDEEQWLGTTFKTLSKDSYSRLAYQYSSKPWASQWTRHHAYGLVSGVVLQEGPPERA